MALLNKTSAMKKNTFKEEFSWLSQFLPEALGQETGEGNSQNIIQTIIQEIENSRQTELMDTVESINFLNVPEIISWEDRETNFESLFEALVEMYESNEGELPATTLAALTTELGRDAFGLYLPMHYYFKSKKTPWGIYLFPDLIMPWAKNLYLAKGKSLGLSLKQVEYAFAYAVFRHELFHHQVERFSTKQEILTHKVNFKAYQENVYGPTRNSKDWIEEALAEATVLNSVHVFYNIEIKSSVFRKLYEFDLKRMPPGYSDYHCSKYGGYENAHRLFASQIVQCKIKPFPAPATSICTVNANEFSTSWKKVPIYMVRFKLPEAIDSPREVVNAYD